MQVQFLYGNSPDSRVIIQQLRNSGIDISNPMHLDDYVHQQSSVPILISGDGNFHQESYWLSRKIRYHIDAKVSFDNHDDFSHTNGRNDVDCANHMRVFQEQIHLPIYFYGVNSDFNIRSAKTPNTVKQYFDFNTVPTGQTLHITIDVDGIAGSYYYTSRSWGKDETDEPNLEETVHFVRHLAHSNIIVALDVVGLDISVEEESIKKQYLDSQEGLHAYYALIVALLEEMSLQ